MTPDNASILSQLKSLEAQIGAIKARLLKSAAREHAPHSFADLYGRLAGKADSSEEDIDATLYRLLPDLEELG